MKLKFHLMLISLFISTGVFSADLTLKLKNDFSTKLQHERFFESLNEAKFGKDIKKQSVKIYNAWRKENKSYDGIYLLDLFQALFGGRWKDAAQIHFIASDGYKQSVSMKDFEEVCKNHRPFLAINESGQKGFSHFNKSGKAVDPGPFYLVWTDFKETDLPKHTDPAKWPYKLSIIELQ